MPKLILTRREMVHAALIIVGIAALLWAGKLILSHINNHDITTAPHQALYKLSLSRLHQGAAIAGVSGQMSYRIEDACDGWNLAQKFVMQFVYSDQPATWLVSDYNTYESKDGRRFQFSTRRTKNGEVTDEIFGKAEKDQNGGGTIIYQRPKVWQAVLPRDVLFPNQHTLKILADAAAGEKMAFVPLFDGSDTTLGADVNNIIKPVKPPYIVRVEEIAPVKPMLTDDSDDDDQTTTAESPTIKPMSSMELNESPLIKGTRAWRVRMAFYPRPDAFPAAPDADDDADPAEADSVPDYEMTLILHSNGVVSSFTLDYPDFSLNADLLSIGEVAKNGC